jgi:predicted alpha/beta hydrolase
VREAGLDDVFIDDITFPAADGYALGATLFLPRGAKQHAVLISSATAVPRNIYRKFAGYLARRGFAVPTYDYRGIGDSRHRAI